MAESFVASYDSMLGGEYKPSGDKSKPIDELFNYAKVLEAILNGVTPNGYFSDKDLKKIQNYICPHWMDVLELN